jgi:hypothetical protein
MQRLSRPMHAANFSSPLISSPLLSSPLLASPLLSPLRACMCACMLAGPREARTVDLNGSVLDGVDLLITDERPTTCATAARSRCPLPA